MKQVQAGFGMSIFTRYINNSGNFDYSICCLKVNSASDDLFLFKEAFSAFDMVYHRFNYLPHGIEEPEERVATIKEYNLYRYFKIYDPNK